jgi:cell wall-associated NlpC family hydrolase
MKNAWTRRQQPRRRRIVLGMIALASTASVASGALAAPTTASAYVATSDAVIAERAADALESLRRWEASGRMADFSAYATARNDAARMTAFAVQVPGSRLESAWASVGVDKQHVLLAALTQLDVPYRSNASKEGVGFDCSGLMLYAFAEAGISLPRSSREQINAALAVDADDAQAGDLVFYPGHVSMYLGAGLIVHSPQSGQTVEVRHVFDRSLRYGDAVAELAAD